MTAKHAILRFAIKDFANLSTDPDEAAFAPPAKDSSGKTYRFAVIPGGLRSSTTRGHVSVVIQYSGPRYVSCSFILRDADGKAFRELNTSTIEEIDGERYSGVNEFIERSTILDEKNNILSDGTLHFDVHLQFNPEAYSHKPSTTIAARWLKMLDSGDGSDVSFKAGDDIFPAHKTVLRANATLLFNCCGDGEVFSPIVINDVKAAVFRIILRYVYGEEVPSAKVIKTEGKDIINAANRFGLIDLKLTVETILAKTIHLTRENIADWLIFGDSFTCPLIKEYAMSYFVARSRDILPDLSEHLKESPKLLVELMTTISESSNDDSRFSNKKREATVDELRKQLHEKGLDIDGSKEMLISRLQESNKRQRIE